MKVIVIWEGGKYQSLWYSIEMLKEDTVGNKDRVSWSYQNMQVEEVKEN